MKNIQLLDCTLRDGGRIIDCAFDDNDIAAISYKLDMSGIDVIEIGFLRDSNKTDYQGNSTFFTDVDQIIPFIKKNNSEYVAFIDYGMFDFASLKKCNQKSVTGLRVGFTKKDLNNSPEDVLNCLKSVQDKGYKLYVQGVNTLNYSDKELIELIELVNAINPYSFGIVDTYGAMYPDDLSRIFEIVNNNLNDDIAIDFHSHNNFQLSFALAQQIISLSKNTRRLIIDCTLNGIGKVAGNLNTELIVDYLIKKYGFEYRFDQILDIIDEYIYKYRDVEEWGYSIPALLSGIYKAHPNNVRYLTSKFRLQSKDIKNILSMIDADMRQRYDYSNIDRLYLEYSSNKVDDTLDIDSIKREIDNRTVLILIPGSGVKKHEDVIRKYVNENKPFAISVNFFSEYSNWSFWANAKQYNINKLFKSNHKIIATSNICGADADYTINYFDIIDRRYKYYDNSTFMLLNFLKKLKVEKIVFAGFDGFDPKIDNYISKNFQNDRHIDEFDELNEEISNMLKRYKQETKDYCEMSFLTPSRFEKAIENV